MTPEQIAAAVALFLAKTVPPAPLYDQLATYLDLLLRWNARTNLTAIRDPEMIVTRHFGESLFAGVTIVNAQPVNWTESGSLLDFGSGGGFPGVPIQLLFPSLKVTLAESQGKKASFLREAVRTLGLATEVWSERVEAMPMGRSFDVVALRAVDKMEVALPAAKTRVIPGGLLAVLGAESLDIPGDRHPIPGLQRGALILQRH